MPLQSAYYAHGDRQPSILTRCHDIFQSCLWRLALMFHCHQRPDRSFSLRDRQVPLCARCLGILIGLILFPLYTHDLRIAGTLIAAMVIDGGTQALNFRTSNNWLRFATGLGFSLGCGGCFLRGVQWLWNM